MMKRTYSLLLTLLLVFVAACGIVPAPPTATGVPAEPTATPLPPRPTATNVPTVEPTQAPASGSQLALLQADNTVRFVKLLEPVTNPNFPGGVLPRGGAANGVVYYADINSPTGGVKRVDLDGNISRLDFIRNENYGVGVWAGDAQSEPRVAWGSYPDTTASPMKAQIWVSAVDGSDARVAYEMEMKPDLPSHLVFQRWSADGRSFYFSQEPWGIGGYIILSGASSLYHYNAGDGTVTEIVPFDMQGGMLCLDDFYGDVSLVADHCGTPTINIHDRGSGATTTIEAPTDGGHLGPQGEAVKEHTVIGSARFSPSGQRVAFALARRNPDAEQGWVAVSEGLSGASKLVWAGETGGSYTVIGWLNDETLLVQWNGVFDPSQNSVWVVVASGTDGYKLADGTFLALVR
jgi:hypothetical protein